MKKKMLSMNIEREIEVGSCFVKILELLFRYYGYDIKTYTIEGICNCLDVLYSGCDFQKEMPPQIFVNKSSEIGKALSEKMPLHIKRKSFKTYYEGMDYIKKEIDEGHPICIAVNTYHLTYSEDYHKKYGGLFNNYHMMIVKGYSDEDNHIYVVDPALNIGHAFVPYTDLLYAWNDGTGIEREYQPYVYYEFRIESEINEINNIILKSFYSNFEIFFSDSKCCRCGIEFQRGYVGLERVCDDLKMLSKYNKNDKFRDNSLNAIFEGGFHLIRYTRLTFQLYFVDYFDLKETYSELNQLFNRWSNILVKLSAIIKLKKYEKVYDCAEELQELIQSEKYIFKSIFDNL